MLSTRPRRPTSHMFMSYGQCSGKLKGHASHTRTVIGPCICTPFVESRVHPQYGLAIHNIDCSSRRPFIPRKHLQALYLPKVWPYTHKPSLRLQTWKLNGAFPEFQTPLGTPANQDTGQHTGLNVYRYHIEVYLSQILLEPNFNLGPEYL